MLEHESNGLPSEYRHLVPGEPAQILATHPHSARLRPLEPSDDAQQCGLSRPRRSDESDVLSLVDLQRDAAQDGDVSGTAVAVGVGQLSDVDRRDRLTVDDDGGGVTVGRCCSPVRPNNGARQLGRASDSSRALSLAGG